MQVKLGALAALGALTVAACVAPAQAQVVQNFDDIAPAFTTSAAYTQTATNTTEGQYTVTSDPSLFNTRFTSFADNTPAPGVNMLVVNGSRTPNTDFYIQSLTLDAGTYTLSAFIRSAINRTPPTVQFFVNGTGIGSSFTPIQDPAAGFQSFGGNFSTLGGNVTFSLRELTGVASGNDFAIDDITLTNLAPEPGSFALLLPVAIGGLAFARRRRK